MTSLKIQVILNLFNSTQKFVYSHPPSSKNIKDSNVVTCHQVTYAWIKFWDGYVDFTVLKAVLDWKLCSRIPLQEFLVVIAISTSIVTSPTLVELAPFSCILFNYDIKKMKYNVNLSLLSS